MLEIWMERSPSFGRLPDSQPAMRRRTSISPKRCGGRAGPMRQSANSGKPQSWILTSSLPPSRKSNLYIVRSYKALAILVTYTLRKRSRTLRKTVYTVQNTTSFHIIVRLHLHIDNAKARELLWRTLAIVHSY